MSKFNISKQPMLKPFDFDKFNREINLQGTRSKN